MNCRHALVIIALASLAFNASCRPSAPPQADAGGAVATSTSATEDQPAATLPAGHPPIDGANQPDMARGKVVETMNTAGYTYVRVQPATGKEFWAATTEFPVKVGDEVVVDTAMPMENYESESLKRTFDLIYFSEVIQVLGPDGVVSQGGMASAGGAAPAAPAASATSSPSAAPGSSLLRQVSGLAPPASSGEGAAGAMPPTHGSPTANPPASIDLTNIEKAPGGLTVAEVTSQADALAGKDVSVRGRVVKFTPRVMGKNWLHLRDGSGEKGDADITVTTAGEAALGDLVLVRGRVVTHQDFGSGYVYDVLIQDATIEAGK